MVTRRKSAPLKPGPVTIWYGPEFQIHWGRAMAKEILKGSKAFAKWRKKSYV